MHKIYIINLFFCSCVEKKIVNQFPCLDKLLFFSLSQDMYKVEINHIIGNYSKQRSFFFVVAKPHENTFYYVPSIAHTPMPFFKTTQYRDVHYTVQYTDKVQLRKNSFFLYPGNPPS